MCEVPPMNIALLERQLEELTALSAVYCGAGEFSINDEDLLCARAALDGLLPLEELRALSASVTVPLLNGEARAIIDMRLPLSYPAAAAQISVSCVALAPMALESVTTALQKATASAATEESEVLLELCLSVQHLAEEQLTLQQTAATITTSAVAPPPLPLLPSRQVPSLHGVRILWFHHIKAPGKRKEIVSLARSSQLRGFCKPGFPGVVVCEGDDDQCEAFVGAVREMRWQAMDVRLSKAWQPEATNHSEFAASNVGSVRELPGDKVDSAKPSGVANQAGQLPQPFIELAEGNTAHAISWARARAHAMARACTHVHASY